MNYSLAKEIYSATPWLMDWQTLPVLTKLLNNTESIAVPEIKCNTPLVLDSNNNSILISDLSQLDKLDENISAVGIIPINGPITVNGGMSSMGMSELSDIMMSMYKDDRIKSFYMPVDSGGGSSMAVDIMRDTILEIRQSKRVDSHIEKGGSAYSACFGIIAATDNIWAHSAMSGVGSVGTMIQFDGREANTGETDSDNIKNFRVYATKSISKNIEFEEALNNNNLSPLINNVLDPVNERFIAGVLQDRPMLNGTKFDTGETKFAKDAIGTYIDGIKTREEVLNMLLDNSISTDNNSNNLNNRQMNEQELKQKHPDVYNSIFNQGVEQGVSNEKDRGGAWMAHFGTDPKKAIEGFKSGKDIGQTDIQEFLVKQTNLNALGDLKKDSAKDFTNPESGKTQEEIDQEAENAFYKNIDATIKYNQN